MAIKATSKRKGSNLSTGRDYSRDKIYNARPEQIRNRVLRNKARREMIKKHGKSALKGKDVGHTSQLAKAKHPEKVGYKIENRKQNRGKDNRKKGAKRVSSQKKKGKK